MKRIHLDKDIQPLSAFIDEIEDKALSLKDHPLKGRMIPEALQGFDHVKGRRLSFPSLFSNIH